ncbi:unnamed protein product [Staurois parvus]|uniref:Uncharacterized protein n=1 Tax=Staurois parvus TaxID=386267 RepID=A0ABN9C9L2_9NEOB|nr:unnamed protein product [Staurois parvus]
MPISCHLSVLVSVTIRASQCRLFSAHQCPPISAHLSAAYQCQSMPP